MPTYDYRCDANDRVVEVHHRMSETLSNWGEVCERIGMDPGDTPPSTPVRRLATGGNLISSSNLGSGYAPPCASGGCCPGGMCGLN